jgi:hypothetical protein
MIRFPCHCSHVFEVADDMAGGLLQCPRCGRLNDVPSLGDLASLSPDGTYSIGEQTVGVSPDTLDKLGRAYARTKVDAYGRELDLRGTLGDPADLGADQVPLELKDAVRPGAPKYDPVTGELIRPMPLKQEQSAVAQQRDIPLATPVFKYADPDTDHVLGGSGILLRLFTATNVGVMAFVFIGHLFLALLGLLALVAIVSIPVMLFMVFLLIGHYGNVIDETATEGRDELPRPLRDLRWHEDLWGPFFQVVLALGLSYGWSAAALFLNVDVRARLTLAAVGLAFGTIVFPAVLLTATTSGTVLNLRPDRVLAVVRWLGWRYPVAVVWWALAISTYLLGVAGTIGTVFSLLSPGLSGAWAVLLHYAVSFPVLLTGIYLMHGFCWFLGLQYRRHHHEFPWVLQRYVGKRPAPRDEGFTVLPPLRTLPRPAAAAPRTPPAAPPVQPLPALPVPEPDRPTPQRQIRYE